MESSFEGIIGKVILVGFSYCSPEGEITGRKQRWGTVISADERQICIREADGGVFSIPPDLRSTHAAPEGIYRLHSTGEEIENPDLLSAWIVEDKDQ